jgi:selenocysteine-specific elongation factor
MRVFGTAGHVDHGKSTLVHALTGINPDRLREEQERQMTIDLGFAWMRLPGGEEVAFIDVPGHRDFIDNMLAGVGGIDAAILVVAADEGVMPQTREHLAILDLLEVPQAVVALTKVDLVDDPAWLALVSEEVRQTLRPTRLAGALILPVSAATGVGLEGLIAALGELARLAPARPDTGRPRLGIDRAFTIAGFGTVVTGTLVDGALEVGQEVEILPNEQKARIRGLQTHKTKVDRAVAGSRAAANLVGVEVRQLERGDVVVLPQTYRPTRMLDARFRHLADSPGPLRHDQQAKLFLGPAQRIARLRILGADDLPPGQEGWLQLVLDRPLVAARGDRFILRQLSPGATLGGGRVVDPHPRRLHRRKEARVLEDLERRLKGTPGEVLSQILAALGVVPLRQALQRAGFDEPTAQEAIKELRAGGSLLSLGGGAQEPSPETIVAESSAWQGILAGLHDTLAAYHDANPLRVGIPREELKSRLRLEARVFGAVLEEAARQGMVAVRGAKVALPSHSPSLTTQQQAQVDDLLRRFREAPYATPSAKECVGVVGEEVLTYLLEGGRLVQLSPEVVLETTTYKQMENRVRQAILDKGRITVAEVRDLFNTSRKYALALMEYLDGAGVTVREGDNRRLVKTPPPG